MFAPDALDYSSPFIRFCRRLRDAMMSKRALKHRRARKLKEARQDRLAWTF